MSMTPFAVKCGNCLQYHVSAAAVRACYFPPPKPVAAVANNRLDVPYVTTAQLNFLRDLGADMGAAVHYTRAWASSEITRLKKEKRMSQPTEAPNRTRTKVPLPMLHAVEDGYYATRLDSREAHTFFRISRPKAGRNRYANCLKIQTQHGDDYMLALVVWPDGKVTVYNKAVEDQLLLVVVDAHGSAMEYARVIGKCMRCNCPLTDERSRWFGIGPECEKHWDWVIPEVIDTKGEFVYGWEG